MNFDEIAERIIKLEGLTFARAAKYGLPHDLREASDLLKLAIIKALDLDLESVAKSIESITPHLRRIPVQAKSADWLNGQESGWDQALKYAAATVRQIAKVTE